MPICAGRSVRIRDARMGTHLWFVVTDPDPVTNKVVIVMLVSERAHTERTLRLHPGDHAFIQHASAVDFGTAKYAPVSKLETALSNNRASFDMDMSPTLLKRVLAGMVESSHTPHDIVDYINALIKR